MKIQEMFDPVKATTQTICSHCGQIIQIGTYYEMYRNKDYHIECIWDKLIGNNESNSYSEAEKYFYSLQKYIGHWPAYGLDVEEDYLSDLELVKVNNRYLKRTPQSQSNLTDTLEYYEEQNETV